MQTEFTAINPAGQDPAHVLVNVLSTCPGGQAVQVVAVVVQVRQFELQGRHCVPDWYVPLGHVATQLVPFSSGVAEPAAQVAQPLAPVQVPQVAWHALHAVPFE